MKLPIIPLRESMPSVAVIGAGISGLNCARTLQDHGLSVTVFEKSRGAGGRISTWRTNEGLEFDHGAQYFTARDDRFRRDVDAWQHDGVVAPWLGRIVVVENGEKIEEKQGSDRYVAVPGMNAICRHMAKDLQVEYQTKVSPPQRHQDHWLVTSDDGADLGEYDAVIVSAPAAQTAQLLADVPELAQQANSVDDIVDISLICRAIRRKWYYSLLGPWP